MSHTLQELAEITAARLVGDGNIQVAKVASIAQAEPGDLVFVQDEKDLAGAGSGFTCHCGDRRRIRERDADPNTSRC